MDYACGVWSNDAFGDRGWLAIALVIFTIWRPNISVFASFLFGGLYILICISVFSAAAQKEPVDYVNPFVGTTNYGTTNPGS